MLFYAILMSHNKTYAFFIGKWCVLYSTEPSKQYFIAKGMKIFFGLEQRVIDTLVLMWLYAPPLRDIIVGTYLTLAYNKDGLKLIEDGIVFKRRENDEGFFYIIFIFFILAFSQGWKNSIVSIVFEYNFLSIALYFSSRSSTVR